MGLFGSFFTPKATNVPTAAPTVASPTISSASPILTHLEAPSAAPLVAKAGITAPAGMAAPDTMSSSAYVHALVQGNRPQQAVGMLAHGLPEQHGVRWAAASCDTVGDKLSAPDKAAAAACKQWLAEPTPANQALAAKAAAAAGHQGPGAWAAQAAAWSKTPAVSTASNAAAPVAPASPLVAKAVTGSVMLAAVLSTQKSAAPTPILPTPTAAKAAPLTSAPNISAPPAAQPPAAPAVDAPNPALMKVYRPFIEKGMAIAAGK